MASKYPAIVDEGFAGTAYLTRKYGPRVYGSPFIKFLANDSVEAVNHAKDIMNREIIDDLLPGNGTDYLVSSKRSTHPSWAAWYASTHHASTGNNQPLMVSRFFNKKPLSGKEHELFDLLQILTTEVGAGVHTASSTVLLNIVAGGKVLDKPPYTSVNPAWRETYLLLEGIDMWPANAGSEEIQKVKEEATKRKLGAMKNWLLERELTGMRPTRMTRSGSRTGSAINTKNFCRSRRSMTRKTCFGAGDVLAMRTGKK